MQCFLCPRRCGIDRAVQPGFCGAMETPRVAKIMLHHWEEPFLSGVNGSGTVFFSGCNLGCVFCQNHEIRDGDVGEYYNAEQLCAAYLSLQEQCAHNINLVTAAHHVPLVAESLRMAKARGLSIPVVYNSGGYELVETLRLLDGLVDVYLPDLKYVSSELSERFSGAPDYFKVRPPQSKRCTVRWAFLCLAKTELRFAGLRYVICAAELCGRFAKSAGLHCYALSAFHAGFHHEPVYAAGACNGVSAQPQNHLARVRPRYIVCAVEGPIQHFDSAAELGQRGVYANIHR